MEPHSQWRLLDAAATCLALGLGLGLMSPISTRRAAGPVAAVPFGHILVNNIGVGVFLLLGCFTGGLVTCCALVFNGYVWGSYLAGASRVAGAFRSVLLVLPHGVFEVPGILCLGAAGFLATEIVAAFVGVLPAGSVELRRWRSRVLHRQVSFGLALLVCGSCVEAWVTPWLITRLGPLPQ